MLAAHARHYRTGAPMPAGMIARLKAAETFNQGFATVEYTAAALVDLEMHVLGDTDGFDAKSFEAEVLQGIGMPEAIAMRHRSPHFQHVFSGDGYSAGYYSYMWSEVMDADAFKAFEEAGNAFDSDPWALTLASSTHLAVERLGLPEAKLTLAQATTYLACAIKSNASMTALGRAQAAVEETGSLPVPMHLRNASTRLMKQLGYGAGYQYPHDEDDHFVPDRNLPEELGERVFYEPDDQGWWSTTATGRRATAYWERMGACGV